MAYVTRPADHAGARPDKFYKTTLFRGDALLLGLNCLEPGQTQAVHDHADQDLSLIHISEPTRPY